VLLYHLQRHSDHHANPTRRYQALRDFEESPVLPTGYAGMIVLAIVPAVWRRVMDPRVLRHFDGDISRANISPRKRERILARYGATESERERREDSPVAGSAEVLAARCPGCSYVYEVESGDEHEGFAAGTAWSDIPDDWCCPDCGVREKVDFVPVETVSAA
jgi:alkane 1-monooxygenase